MSEDYEEEPDRLPHERDLLEYREDPDPIVLTRVFDALALPLFVITAQAETDMERAVATLEATFLALCDDIDAWERSQPLLGWLAAVAARCTERGPATTPDMRAPLSEPLRPNELALGTELIAAFDSMPPILRQTLQRHSLHGLDPVELAQTLHIDIETVHARLRGAFEHLRKHLPLDVHTAVDRAESGGGLSSVRRTVIRRIRGDEEPPDRPVRTKSRTGRRSPLVWLALAAVVLAAAAWALLAD